MKLTPGTLALTLLLAAGFGCGKKAVEAPPPPLAAAPTTPWSWHPLGGLAVVEGEVTEGTDLVLEGRSIRETRYAEPGPVRWEFYRPPLGETAVLRTGEGRELARFEFILSPRKQAAATPPSRAPKVAATVPRPPPPVPLRRPASGGAEAPRPTPIPKLAQALPPTPAPQPVPEAPRVRAEARARTQALPPLTSRAPLRNPGNPESIPSTPARPSARLPQLTAEATPPPPPYRQPATLPPVRGIGQGSGPWPGMGEALNLTRGPVGSKRLLLSFDGGSAAEVAPEVLDTLKARGVRTTIFLTGAFIRRFPALVKRMAAEGHELGNHTMNHPHFAPGMKRDPLWTRERVQRELLDADAALVQLLGRPMDPYWRAPYGEHTAEIRRWAEEVGYRHVGWSEGADTLDWATPKERQLYRSGDVILKRLQTRLNRDGDGLIVLMHLGSERAAGDRPSAGLGAFMDRAHREGWTFVPVGSFLHDLGKPAWDPQHRLALLQAPGPPLAGR